MNFAKLKNFFESIAKIGKPFHRCFGGGYIPFLKQKYKFWKKILAHWPHIFKYPKDT